MVVSTNERMGERRRTAQLLNERAIAVGDHRISAPSLSLTCSLTFACISLTSSFDKDLRHCQELKETVGHGEAYLSIER